MSKPIFRVTMFCVVLVAHLALPVSRIAGALFVLDSGSNAIGEYSLDGSPRNPALVTGLSTCFSIAMSGDRASLFTSNEFSRTISKYHADAGAVINSSFVSTDANIQGVAVSGSNLYVISQAFGRIEKYDAATGAAIDESFITGLSGVPHGLAVAGSDLFVTNYNAGTIGKYDANNGAVRDAAFITGLSRPYYVTVAGQYLYVTDYTAGTVGKYDATTGEAVNTALVSGLTFPSGISVEGSNLYVVSDPALIGKYNANTGALINANLISGLNFPFDLVAVPVTPGDFDDDGDLDVSDFATLTANLHSDITNLTTQETFLLGDLTADLRIDGRDFVAFRTAYDEANGVGAFTAMLETIPEPSTLLLAIIAGAVAWRRPRRLFRELAMRHQ